MSSSKHIIYCPLGGVGLFDDPDDEEWLSYRIDIFKRYTLKSLLNQSRKPDLLWISVDGRENSQALKELGEYLKPKINYVITHEGLIYIDDKFIFRWGSLEKYESSFRYAFRMFGRSIKRKNPLLFARFLSRLFFKNAGLEGRIQRSLVKVREAVFLPPSTAIYLTRLDSDDLLHKDYLAECALYKIFNTHALLRQNGFVYNIHTKELACWNPNTNPQFFTLIMHYQDFQSGEDFKEAWNDYTTHEDAPRVFNFSVLEDDRYTMLMHGNQISSNWEHPFRGQEIALGERDEILSNFGL